VPGVAKCGPKTAVKWLTQYGTLDNLVAHADEWRRRRREPARPPRLPAAGRKLVTVVCDLPDLPAPPR
jgi:DNA polymerase-1